MKMKCFSNGLHHLKFRVLKTMKKVKPKHKPAARGLGCWCSITAALCICSLCRSPYLSWANREKNANFSFTAW